jgi:hypothetical protein
MQHARRMVLVPDDQQQQPLRENLPNPPAPVSSFRNIDSDIENVLSKKNISDFEKIALYNSILNKYLIKFHAQKDTERAARDQHIEDLGERGMSDSKTEIDRPANGSSKDDNFNIVKNILQQSATVTWDDKGKVFVNGEPTGSAINSLVTHLISQNEFKTLPGWSIFLEAVKKLNIPKAYTPALSRKRKLIDGKNIEPKVRKIDTGLKRKNTEFDFPIKHQKTDNSKAAVLKRKVDDTPNKRASGASLKGKKRQIAEGSTESEKKRQKVASQAAKRKSSEKLDKTSAKRSKTANKLKRHIEDDTENLANKRIKLAPKKRGIASEEKPGGKRRKIEATEKKVKKATKKNDKSGKKIKWLGYK